MKAEQLFDVRGLVAAVTGGASGIGYAMAEAMADNGARVTLVDRDAAALRQAAEALSRGGAEIGTEVADVTDKAAIAAALARIAGSGRLGVVFANAGISGGPGFLKPDRSRDPDTAIESLPGELWDRVMAVNMKGLFHTLQAAATLMKPQGSGRIVVTTSISATKIEQHVGSIYVASKAGAAQLVRQVALELAGYGITVNAIAPGPVATNIAGGRLKEPEAQRFFGAQHPMRRIARPDDIQGAALFLASPASSFMTGATITIDGGNTLGTAD